MNRFSLLPVLVLSLTAAAAAPAEGRGLAVGHSGWQWSNPLPQGNSIRALDFAGLRGYAVGDFGTLLRTDDGGLTWSGVATGLTEDLVELEAIDGDSLFLAGGCALRRSDDGGESLEHLSWTGAGSRCSSPIASLAFPTGSVGHLAQADGAFYRTGDGGEVWERMTDVPGTAATGGSAMPTDLAFTDEDTGIVATTEGIHRTTNGGFSWRTVAHRPERINAVFFADSETGYAVGDGSTVLKTADGGVTWAASRPLAAGPSARLRSVACAGADTCIATVAFGDAVLLTRDGGVTWSARPTDTAALDAVAFPLPERAVAAGASGALAISPDGGLTWTSMAARLPGRFTRLRPGGGSLAFAIGERGALALSPDGGLSWTVIGVPTAEPVVDVSFLDGSSGYALDAAGVVFRTVDAGASWEIVQDGGAYGPQAILALGRGRVLLIGSRGIRVSNDAGATFRALRRPAVRGAGLFDVDRAGRYLFAYGPTSLLVSPDRGRNWRKLRRPDHRPLGTVDFVSSRVGFALGKGGLVWRTRNRARTWQELYAVGTEGATALAFENAREGYLATRDVFFARGTDHPDYLLRTVDGGRRWRPQVVADSRHFNGLLATRRSDFLLADGDLLFFTETGGDRGGRATLRLSSRRRRIDRPGRVAVSGRLAPARGGERVTVSMRPVDPRLREGARADWSFASARVTADGSFRTAWNVRRTSVFVAQWPGNEERRGAGSKVLKVRVRGR
jgi:photosystem II stability/assembly factor-like uncharacterized protein